MWFISMGLRQGSGLGSSSSHNYPGTEGTNQNRHWNHHRWHATDSLERTRLSCWCLCNHKGCTYRAPVRYVTQNLSVVILNKKIHILLSQVYCVRQIVKTLTIIWNNPVYRNAKQPHVSILYTDHRRPRRSRCLRRGFAAARLLGLRVRIPPGAWMFVVSVMCCQVEVCATGWSVFQRNLSKCDVSGCDRETSTRLRPLVAIKPSGFGGGRGIPGSSWCIGSKHVAAHFYI